MSSLVALHGFLGKPSDWLTVSSASLDAKNIYDYGQPIPGKGFGLWAAGFNAQAVGDTLIGYSLGARLALHALIADPGRWKKAILISAHPGVSDPLQRAMRRESDRNWAHEFLTQDWEILMKKWNRQPVFETTTSLERGEKEYDRRLLADTLLAWSLAEQEPLHRSIEALELPIIWVSGSRDKKFSQQARTLKFKHPHSCALEIPGGHRLLWDNPKALQALYRSHFKI